MSQQRIGTQCLHAGYTPGNGEPRNIPIVQSTTFRYATGEQMGALFDLEESGYFYTRLQNPTNDHVAAKICALEGGTAALRNCFGRQNLPWWGLPIPSSIWAFLLCWPRCWA